MLKRAVLLLFTLFPVTSWSQLLSVTATLTDPDSTVWKNATCTVQVYSPVGKPFFGSTPVPTAPQACSVDGSGVLTTSIYNTTTITPAGALYRWSINSATSAPGDNFLIPVSAANMTAALSAQLVAPRFNATIAFTYGYTDTEAVAGAPGSQYYNTTTPALRVWSGSAWTSIGGGGGTTSCPSTTNILEGTGSAGGCQASPMNDNGTNLSTTTRGLLVGSTGATSQIFLGMSITLAPGFNYISFNGAGENGSLLEACYGASAGGTGIYCDVPTGLTFNMRSSDGTTFGMISNMIVGPNGFVPRVFTVSTLPSAATAGAGSVVLVSDASTFTVGTCTGGGSDYMVAVSNGTTWSCH